jgi:DNA-binding response OmpR family regulator
VAHDFNNLLTAISASLELILHGRNDEARTRELAAIALAASQRGATLVGQMLSYARRQSLRPKPCNVNDLIERIETLLRRTAGDLIGWRCRLDPLVWLADLDQAHFESALMNLVVNARDAMKQGGQLTLESRNFVVDEAYAADLGDIAPGNYVVVTVRDTGSGMAPEVRARAIEPFYTTKDVGAGSGLGLSQVYGFVRQSNGQIAIESTPGEGTAVNLYLPQSREVQHAAAAAPDTDIAFGNGSVLVVEDDPEVLHIAASAIRSFGYHVHRAGDAAAALTVLRAAPKVDLLFTDIVMPGGMSGVELAREACRRYPNLRVLLASGYARDVLEAQESMHDGMAFIAKPYALSALSAMVRTLVS